MRETYRKALIKNAKLALKMWDMCPNEDTRNELFKAVKAESEGREMALEIAQVFQDKVDAVDSDKEPTEVIVELLDILAQLEELKKRTS